MSSENPETSQVYTRTSGEYLRCWYTSVESTLGRECGNPESEEMYVRWHISFEVESDIGPAYNVIRLTRSAKVTRLKFSIVSTQHVHRHQKLMTQIATLEATEIEMFIFL